MWPALLLLRAALRLGDPLRHRIRGSRGRGIAAAGAGAAADAAAPPPRLAHRAPAAPAPAGAARLARQAPSCGRTSSPWCGAAGRETSSWPFVVAAAIVAGCCSFDPDGTLAEVAGWLAATWAGLTIVIGPQWVRNDLRSDLLKLDLLRSYPLRGRSVVAAEAAASTLVLTALQLGLLVIAYLAFLGNQPMEPDLETRTAAAPGRRGVPARDQLPGDADPERRRAAVPRLGASRSGPAQRGRGAGAEHADDHRVLGAPRRRRWPCPRRWRAACHRARAAASAGWAALPAAVVLLAGVAAEAAVMIRWLGPVFERMDPASAGFAA